MAKYHKCWNDFIKAEFLFPTSSTLHDLREASRYYVVTDKQLKKDLQPRTLKDIYRENAAGRRNLHIPPRSVTKDEYMIWCRSRQHKPHPASVDPKHPIALQRENLRYVKRDTVRK